MTKPTFDRARERGAEGRIGQVNPTKRYGILKKLGNGMFSLERSSILRKRAGNTGRRPVVRLASMGISAQLAIGLLLAAAAAAAGPTEQLSAQIPAGWAKARESNLASLTVSEWVPRDTKGAWQQKLTLEALEGEDLPDPIQFVDGLVEIQRDACNEFADSPLFAGFENGYPTAVHILECHQNKVTQKPLLTMVKAIQGNAAFYTITRIWRLEPRDNRTDDDGTLPIDASIVAAWAAELRQFKLCDPALQAHACDALETTETELPSK